MATNNIETGGDTEVNYNITTSFYVYCRFWGFLDKTNSILIISFLRWILPQ